MPINELDGYDLVAGDSLGTSNGFEFVKEASPTNTTGDYGIVLGGQRIGRATLAFDLHHKKVGFDVVITEPGSNLGATALHELAGTLDDRGFSLVTAGIMPASRGYWEHLAEKGDVVPVDASNPKTEYRVVPAVTIYPENN